MLAVTFLFLLIFCQTFKISVINGANLREKAIDQWTRELPIKAKRGDILDANGMLLAGSKGTYSIYVRPRSVDNASEVAKVLSNLFEKNYDELHIGSSLSYKELTD